MPPIAAWGMTGRIQATPITWGLLLIIRLTTGSAYDDFWPSIWILTAIGLLVGCIRLYYWNHDRNTDRKAKRLSWCRNCENNVQAKRPPFPAGWLALTIASAALIHSLSGLIFTLPVIIFAVWRLTRSPLCPECRNNIPGGKVPLRWEGLVMGALIPLCIGFNIAQEIYLEPSAECSAAVETVQQQGGPNLLEASDSEKDRWLEEEPGAWDLLDKVDSACWEE